MTVKLPPLIKPDGRFSRIRLSEFLCRKARALRYRTICRSRIIYGDGSPDGPSPHPSLLFVRRNKWHPFAPPWVVQTSGLARDHRYYERLRLLPWPDQPCPGSPDLGWRLACRHRDRSPRLPERHFSSCRPRRPRRSVAMPITVVVGRHRPSAFTQY